MVQRWNRCDFPDWKYLPYAAPTLSWPISAQWHWPSKLHVHQHDQQPPKRIFHAFPSLWMEVPSNNRMGGAKCWDKSGCNGKWWIFWKGIIPMKAMTWYGRHSTRQFQFRTCEQWKRVTVKTKFEKTSPQIIDQIQHPTPCLWVHLMDPFVLRTKNAFCLRLKMWDPQYPLSPLQSSHIVREWMGCPPRRRSYFGSLKPFLSGEPRIPIG